MNDEPTLPEQAQELVARLQEPLNLDRWNIQLKVGSGTDARASCASQPEYREAEIGYDFDKIKTGDDLQELTAHEMTHPHIEPLALFAAQLAEALAASAPVSMREPLKTLLCERVRYLEEQVTTDVGHVMLKLLRRAQILATPPVA